MNAQTCLKFRLQEIQTQMSRTYVLNSGYLTTKVYFTPLIGDCYFPIENNKLEFLVVLGNVPFFFKIKKKKELLCKEGNSVSGVCLICG